MHIPVHIWWDNGDVARCPTTGGCGSSKRTCREQQRASHDRNLVIGIVLCVLAALPLFATMLFVGEPGSFAYVLSNAGVAYGAVHGAVHGIILALRK